MSPSDDLPDGESEILPDGLFCRSHGAAGWVRTRSAVPAKDLVRLAICSNGGDALNVTRTHSARSPDQSFPQALVSLTVALTGLGLRRPRALGHNIGMAGIVRGDAMFIPKLINGYQTILNEGSFRG